jgi:hypothetical protein
LLLAKNPEESLKAIFPDKQAQSCAALGNGIGELLVHGLLFRYFMIF